MTYASMIQIHNGLYMMLTCKQLQSLIRRFSQLPCYDNTQLHKTLIAHTSLITLAPLPWTILDVQGGYDMVGHQYGCMGSFL